MTHRKIAGLCLGHSGRNITAVEEFEIIDGVYYL